MDLITKICAIIILLCVCGLFYVSYKFIKIMGFVGFFEPGKIIKEMIHFFVFIILFGMVISTTAKILIKQREFLKEQKRVP